MVMRQLYPFQEEGVDFLVQHGGGFLWDDPGLGKTTTAAVAADKLGKGPNLVVCPSMLRMHWRRELKALFPGARIYHATTAGRFQVLRGRKLVEISLPEAIELSGMPDWVVVHYTGLRLSVEAFASVNWSAVIADECHYIKNRSAARTKALMEATPNLAYRIGCTATPQNKSAADLWSQLRWRAPHQASLGNYYRWCGIFVEYEKGFNPHTGQTFKREIGTKNQEALAKVLNLYGISRSKQQVAPQLPAIRDIDVPLELEGRSAKIYKAIMNKNQVDLGVRDSTDEAVITRVTLPNVLARLTRAEQWLSHPWTTDSGVKGSKLEWLIDWASSYEYPFVVITRFKETSRHIAKLFGTQSVTGDTHKKIRQQLLDAWTNAPTGKTRENQILVGTAQVLGTGLNLQRGYAMVCYDSLYDSIVMQQARERIHRINSDHPVDIYWLYNVGTTNEIIQQVVRGRMDELELVKRFIRLLRAEED